MNYLKYNSDGKLVVCGVFLILCASLGSGRVVDTKVIQYQKRERFILSSRLAQADRTIQAGTKVVHMGANVVRLVKGQLNWVVQDANGFALDVAVPQIDINFPHPQPKEPGKITRAGPFSAHVRMSKNEEVPLSIQITKGRGADNSLEVGEQYKILYLILDLMCATALEREFLVSEDGLGVSLRIKYVDKANIDRYGELPVTKIRSSLSPSEFAVFPQMSYKKVEGTHLFTFTHGNLTIHEFSRLVDNKSGFAVHAVNLEATAKQEMRNKDYIEMVRALNAPHEFQHYSLHELKVTNVE